MHGRQLLRAEVDKSDLSKVAARIGATRWAVARWLREGREGRTPGIGFILAMAREFNIAPESWARPRRSKRAA